MKKFIASGFGVGILWEFLFKDKKGGGTLASFLFALFIYILDLNLLILFLIFVGLIAIYYIVVDDKEADDDPSWITLDEICGMSLVTLVSQGDLLPLVSGFLILSATSILDYIFRELAISYLNREDLAHTPSIGNAEKQIEEKSEDINDDQNQLLKIVKDISSKGFLRSNYKKKLVDLSDIRINLKGKK